MIVNILGNLVSQLGLSEPLAFAIVSAITYYGAYGASAIFPIIAPFVLTLQGMLAVAGAGFVVGW